LSILLFLIWFIIRKLWLETLQSQEQLTLSNRYNQQILNTMQDMLFLVDHQGRILDANRSAQKQLERAQEIPLSLSVIDRNEIQQQRLWYARDLSGWIPNLFSSHSGDGRNVTGIRGIVTTSYDPAVATYVDGVIQFDLDTYFNSMIDVERIEVLRGPQGTLYGRNAMGGVINIITRQKTDKTTGFIGGDFGNYGLQRYTASIKSPLVKDRLFLGVSGLLESHNGFYTNAFDGSSFDKRQTGMGNYFLRYQSKTPWSFLLNIKHQSLSNYGAFPLASSISAALEKPFVLNQNAISKMSDDIFNSSLVINHRGQIVDFHSQTSFQSNSRIYESPLDGDFSPLDIVSIINNYGKPWNQVKAWTQEIRLSSTLNSVSQFSWLAGVFGFLQEEPSKQGTYFGNDAGIFGLPMSNFTSININEGKNKGYAIFGQGKYAWNKYWDVTLGLRFDREIRHLRGTQELAFGNNPPFQLIPNLKNTATFNAFSPKFGVTRHLQEGHLLFGSYARGFRAGGLTPIGSDPSVPPLKPFDPERSDNFELGAKNEWVERGLKLNFSLFYTRVTDIQVPQLILPDAIVVTTNEGDMRSFGGEMEVSQLIGENLMFTWNGGYTNAKFTNLSIANEDSNEELRGNRQIFTPEYTSLAMVQYQQKISNTKDLRLLMRLEWQWIGRTYFDLSNQLVQDPYHRLNARVGLQKDNWEIAFWGRNMMNTTFIDYAYNFGAAHLGDPATFGVSFKVSFEK
jgi:iron complex outermembrane receptor protein